MTLSSIVPVATSMEGPRKSTSALQRHSSLPPPRSHRPSSLTHRLNRHSSLRRTPTAASATIVPSSSNRLNKSNPYVGSFRHAPPSSISTRGTNFLTPSSLHTMKTSPYIGWFRHAPPSRLNRLLSRKRLDQLEDELSALLGENATKKTKLSSHYYSNQSPMVSGHLKGGAPEFRPFRTQMDLNRYNAIQHHLRESSSSSSSAAGSPSATLKVLSRLASWFLFPLAHDADSCGYRHNCRDNNEEEEKTTVVTELFPHLFPSTQKTLSEDDDDENSETDDSEGEDDDESTVSTVTNDYPNDPQVPGNNNHDNGGGPPLDISVSSLAEAYYAHQAAKALDDSTHIHDHDGNSDDNHNHDEESTSHRLDYVITQMDIARMARNASRHLDVASILSLPTMTYRSGTPPSMLHNDNDEALSDDEHEDAGWSWMIVPPASKQQDVSSDNKQHNNDDDDEASKQVCVICLEHFVDGDRLRLLPCNHSFHVGCIDRWLSGSHSFEGCYTSGCPTCKKRPEILPPPPNSKNGSVVLPSWAFARIGDALAKDSVTSLY